jgi:4-aminobutyrate aminotransferase/(S)-3-amino-2-methylpropionate transaminase
MPSSLGTRPARPAVFAFDNAYHGRINLTMALTAKSMPYKHRFGPFAPEVYRVPISYPFRDGGLTGEQAAERAIAKQTRVWGTR